MSKKRFFKAKTLLTILLLLQVGVYAQLKTITGVVKDDKGAPLPKASITAKGAKKGVTSKDDGTFSISVPTATTALTISYSGFEDKVVDIKDKTDVSVALTTEVKKLEDVIVQTGYGTQKAKDVTGDITQVKGAAVKNLATQDAATMLQGRVAGVEVVAASGQPGASGQILIRGASSLYKTEPLYVIDGVKQPNGNNINPQDIESMTVLKDASAAAIYGAAAAGGVIIITTKRGKGAQPTINFSSRYSITTPEVVQMLNKSDFLKYETDIKDPFYSNPGNASLIASYIPVDWNKELYRNGSEQDNTLSISGSAPSVDYFLSGVYNNQQGVFLDNNSSFAGARINTDFKFSPSIKIGEQLNVSREFTIPVKTPIVSTPFESQPLFTGPLYSSVPGTAWGIYPNGYHGGINSVSQIKTTDFEFPATNFQGQVYLEVKLPVKYLTFKATLGYTSQSYENNLFQKAYTTNGTPLLTTDGTAENHLYRNIGNYQQTLNAYILAYDHTWGKHTLNLLAGYEQYANTTENLQASVYNVLGNSFSFGNGFNGGNGGLLSSSSSLAGNENVSGGYDPQGLVKSQFGRINYDFNKRYFATLTVRRDGNFQSFGQDNQYGIFPAVSAGWNISDERFFKKYRGVINQLKLRGSYGELGNSNIPGYSFNTAYNPVTVQNFTPGGAPQVANTQQAIGNENIQWESTHETNIGIDGQMLNGKINFTIDWYNKNTTKLLFNTPVSLSSGVPANGAGFVGGAVSPGSFLENIGSVRNQGLDIALGYAGKARQVNYSISATGSFNTNKILDIVEGGIPDGYANFPYGTSIWKGAALTRSYAGNSFGEFWGLKSLGIIKSQSQITPEVLAREPNAQVGDLLYASDTPTLIGNPYPKFTYGVNMNANWKNLDISLLFNGVMGVQLYNGVTPFEFESLDGSNVTSKVFQASGFLNNGVANGPGKYPSVGRVGGFGNWVQDPNGNYTTPSSYFVENGSYLKLKNIQIGYTISTKMLERARIKSLRIYVMANNVFTITKYTGVDPELGSQYAILGVDKNGNVVGNGDGSTAAAGNSVTTSRGIDGPSKYPNVKLYAAGINIVF
jgi:TonB-linked SusC/RagA family outer membrane protein